jgi:CheY-like chemotaxis protein
VAEGIQFMMMDMVRQELPLLRRYARALTGSQEQGDRIVRNTLEALIANSALMTTAKSPKSALFKTFHTVQHGPELNGMEAEQIENPIEKSVHARFGSLETTGRHLLLLTSLENFPLAEAADIIGLPIAEAANALAAALDEIDRQSRSDILIIEDEPLIAMELESLVTGLGHRVVGNATTHREAISMFRQTKPDLVLADIQLADGSSGINAVKEILSESPIPVIFITAFPERLLTGERPEPTYLISKPYSENTVKVAVSQALFLKSTARPFIESSRAGSNG